jgi:pyridoxal phosphate enzyme (YggS family)
MIQARLQHVQQAVAQAAYGCGRNPQDIVLVAVSKKQPLQAVIQAYDAGVRDFGENHAQELVAKSQALAATGRVARWHFIGQLQRNKVSAVLGCASMIQSVDRLVLAQAIAQRVPESAHMDVLVQVNIGNEPQKGGVAVAEAVAFAQQVACMPRLRVCGMMAVPPAGVDPVPYFHTMQTLFEAFRQTSEGAQARVLSLGMTDDFTHAVACGSTMVRVGSGIFGTRL